MVLQSVKILVSFTAYVTFVRLLFLHSEGARVWSRGLWIDNGKRSITILRENLVGVAMLELENISASM